MSENWVICDDCGARVRENPTGTHLLPHGCVERQRVMTDHPADATPRLDQAARDDLRRWLEGVKELPWAVPPDDAWAIVTATDSEVGNTHLSADAELIVRAVNALPALLDGYERVERLEAALREYGGHKKWCHYFATGCNCGFDQALAASGATAIRVRYDSSTGRPLPGHDAAGQQQEEEG
jgi:hypothetical protein